MVDLRSLYEMELPTRAVSVYQYLFLRADREGQCWPAIPTIAKDLKLSEKTVRRAIEDLRRCGHIETEQRYRKSGGKAVCCFMWRKKFEIEWK